MDLDATHGLFVMPRPGAVFGQVMAIGGVAVAGWLLLRPWPASPRRKWGFALAAALGLLAWLALLGTRRVEIDSVSREVRRCVPVLGFSRCEQWGYEHVAAVAVRLDGAAGPGRYTVGLDTPSGWLPLAAQPQLGPAESLAAGLAAQGGWPALRRGYRLESHASAGPAQRFATGDGRQGVVMDLAPLREVVPAPGQDSAMDIPAG